MSFLKKLCLSFVALLAISSNLAAEELFLQSKSLLQKLSEQVVEKKLSNGIRVLFYKRGKAPVISASISVRVGGVDETPGSTGISHMLEHMAFKGSTSIGTKDFKKEKKLLDELESLVLKSSYDEVKESERGKQILSELKELWEENAFDKIYREIGAVALNATTAKETTDYFVSFPRSAFEIWCQVEADRMINPVMRHFYPERDVVMEERRMRYEDDPNGKIYEELLKAAYQVHPYKLPVIGYEEDLRSLTASQTAEFHAKYYRAENITIAIVGDVNADKDFDLVNAYFGQIPSGLNVEAVRNLPKEPEQEAERLIKVPFKSNPIVAIGYKKPNYPHPDDAPITVLAHILAGGRTAVLYRELVQRRQVLVAIAQYEAPGSSYPNMLVFRAIPKKGFSNEDVLENFDEVLSTFIDSNVTREDLLKVQRALARSYIDDLNSSLGLARNLASTQAMYGNWKVHLDWFQEMLSVTEADVQRVAKKYLKPARRTVAFIEVEK